MAINNTENNLIGIDHFEKLIDVKFSAVDQRLDDLCTQIARLNDDRDLNIKMYAKFDTLYDRVGNHSKENKLEHEGFDKKLDKFTDKIISRVETLEKKVGEIESDKKTKLTIFTNAASITALLLGLGNLLKSFLKL